MIRKLLFSIVAGLFISSPAFAQYTYAWRDQDLLVYSPVEFQSEASPYGFRLEGNDIVIKFATLEGLGIVREFASLDGTGGVERLARPLETYAILFGYEVKGWARELWYIKKLDVARIDGEKDGNKLILLMLATKDFCTHFTCEITFPESQRNHVEMIIRGITIGADGNSIVFNEESAEEGEAQNMQEENQLQDSSQRLHNRDQPGAQTQTSGFQPGNESVTNLHLIGTPVQKLTWQLLSIYSPDGYFILDEFYNAPTSYGGQSQSGDDDFSVWIHGESEEDIIKSLNTVVHEMDHGFNQRVYLKVLQAANKPVESGGYSSFYLGNKEIKVVKHTDVFSTKEINTVFPQNFITSRYETYVYPSEEIMGSQQEGVYGLLDEWNAYYNGTKTSFDLYHYYKEKRDDAAGWAEFFTDYYGTYYAYLEFKSYILVYMMYAQKNYPQLYQGFLNNKDLLYSLKKTDEIWRILILNFKELRKKIMADLSARGMEVEEKDDFIFINGSGSGNFSEIYNKFQEELKNAEYHEMARALGFSSAGGPDF